MAPSSADDRLGSAAGRAQGRGAILLRGLLLGGVAGAVWGTVSCTAIIIGGVVADGQPETLVALVLYLPAAGVVGSITGIVTALSAVAAVLLVGTARRAGVRVAAGLAATPPALLLALGGVGWRMTAPLGAASVASAVLLAPWVVSGSRPRRTPDRLVP